jgi:hypothetical protein
MLAHKIVNAESQRHGELVHFEALAVAKTFSLKSLQFLSHAQECALYSEAKFRAKISVKNYMSSRIVLHHGAVGRGCE